MYEKEAANKVRTDAILTTPSKKECLQITHCDDAYILDSSSARGDREGFREFLEIFSLPNDTESVIENRNINTS